ncbi:MAG: radical SAM protein [Thermodesulfobacteriota bacterium]
MGRCRFCRKQGVTISEVIGFCADCLREKFDLVWPEVKRRHDESRRAFGLPTDPPRAAEGLDCPLCHHQCRVPEGGTGYCGLRRAREGRLTGGRPHEGNLSWYFDPLPTNCVGSFVCPAGTGSGYPEYGYSPGPEFGYKNLAVFYRACSFNCLFCQNYHFKAYTSAGGGENAAELAGVVDDRTACLCFFGGDPGPQVLHALKTATLARRRAEGRVLRICWETNGAVSEPFVSRMARVSLESGGLVKFDLKAWDPRIHLALCGVDNRRTLENFRRLSGLAAARPDPPLLIAGTLLVPGYVDIEEVSSLATFLAGLGPDIPYRLLAFYPSFFLRDLPVTSREHARRCREAAVAAGLTRVSLGNVHLLGADYP